MVRSLENFPELATFRIALCAHAPGSAYNCAESFLRLDVRGQIRQVHVVIAAGQQRIAQRIEYSRFVAAEVVGENEVQCRPSLRLMIVMPVRAVPGAAVLDLFDGQAEKEHVFFASLLRHLDGRAVARSDGQRLHSS